MESKYQYIAYTVFKMHHHNIVQDIQGDVIMALFEKQILTKDEYQYIKSVKDREKEASCLLKLLPSKGNYAINEFLNYLSAYYSWISESIQKSITNEYNNKYSRRIRHALILGEVPQLSSRHISRDKHVKALKELLLKLEDGQFVVVNGMTGCGKSSLVVEVLNDPLITMQYFQGFVQWINVGRENSSDVGSIQTEILNRLNNQEQLISCPLNTDYEATRKTLQNLWKKKQTNGGLLVLDDVCSNQIVKYLDIGCKILITTHDESIMDEMDKQVQYLKVNEGFEENETLELFSKCLTVDYKSLPPHASEIHNLCKGFPLTISLIGAQLEAHKEETINSTDRWKFYLEELSDKTSDIFKYTRYSHKQLKSLDKTIVMCIKSLPDELQKNYQDFSLFVYDLNIKPEVLSVLWNLKKIHAEDIMLELIRKNLLVRVWNQPLKSYVYSIHDLLLSNLKKMITNQESKALHKKLIERYRVVCHGNFAELPKNDNYIFLYIGYHLENADMLEEFPRWFLNLKFLESKIYAAGPADLLADLRKYRKYITVRSIYEEYIKEIEQFVKCYGPNLYQTKSDIVQLGLQEPENSFIYNESYKIAKHSGKSYFYYNIRDKNGLSEPHVCIVRDKIERVIFGNRHDEVLIATTSGNIKLWNIRSNKCLHTYNGHTAKITHLVKNKYENIFLSTSDDSTIRIWNMKSFPESNDSETRTPSPETRQDHWQNLFNQSYKKPTNITDCVFVLDEHSGPVIFANFSSNKLLVSSSTDKTLKIWKLDNGTLIKSINQTSIIYQCYFMKNTSKDCILYSQQTQTGSAIYRCQWPFDHPIGLLYLTEELISFFPLPSTEGDDKLLIMTANKMDCYQFNWEKSLRLVNYPQPISYQHFKICSISEQYTSNINKSRYIAFSLSNNTIKVCDLLDGYNFLDLNHHVQKILNLDWFWSKMDQNNWLLCATEDKSIILWCLKDVAQYKCTKLKNICKNEVMTLQNYKLFTEEQNLYCYKLKQNFNAVWLNNNSLLVAAITQCGTLKILLEGLDQWSLIDKKVSALSIVHSDRTFDKTMIIVACEDYSVYMLNYQTSHYLFNTSNNVENFFIFCDNDNLTIAIKLKNLVITDYTYYNNFEFWTQENQFKMQVKNFIDCYVLHNVVFLLCNIHELMIIDVNTEVISKLEMNYYRINKSLFFDDAKLAVISSGQNLTLFKIINNAFHTINYFQLPFIENELLSFSFSNDQCFIVVGGQKSMVLINRKSMIISDFIIDSNINNIQSIVWSTDDTRLAIKDDNHIIIFDVESRRQISSVRLTADKFSVDSTLKTYIAVNSVGQLVMLKLH